MDNIARKKRRSIKRIHLIHLIGLTMKRMMSSLVLMEGKSLINMMLIEQTVMDLDVTLKCTNVSVALVAPCVIYVPKQKREITEKYFIMKNGKRKNHILESSFQTKRLAKFTVNVK